MHRRKRRGSVQHLENLPNGQRRVPIRDFHSTPSPNPRWPSRRNASSSPRYRDRARKVIGAGPAWRLEPAADDAIQALVLRVRSLATAEGFLRERGLLGEAGDGWVALAPEATQGVAILLCEACG